MSTPFDSFQQGMMTGQQLGAGLRQRRNQRELGGLMASGDTRGAMTAAYGQGDLQTGMALQGQVQEQAGQERQGQIVGALRSGDYSGAAQFAQSPEELAQIDEFKANASAQDIAAASQRAEQLAMVLGPIMSLPPDQQFAAAQQAAAAMGMDPNSITPDMVTPQNLETTRMRALGLKEYLNYQQEERAALRPIIGNGFVSLPPGSAVPGQPEVLDALPQGARIRPRPNQPPSAPAAGGGERSQTPRVSFRSSQEAQATIQQIVPGVTITSGRRSQAEQQRLIQRWEASGRRGVRPASNSFHLQDRARDLVPPAGMSMAQLAAKMQQAGFRVLNEGTHVHTSW